jgi:hypothetical protein
MQYPLAEKIGNPDLLVGRETEFNLINKWLSLIPDRMSKSKVILARRKSGKTVFIQRIFNQLWSDPKRGVIPFYFDISENKAWYPYFAIDYYCSFASQYISFIERNEKLIRQPLTLEEIREYGLTHSNQRLVGDVDSLLKNKERGFHDAMWKIATTAHHRFAALFDLRFLVILDEFQNITQYIYRDEKCEGKPDETLAGSFHSLSESKLAPMLVTGSYVGWLIQIIGKYLEAGRLKRMYMSPYLAEDDALEAVYKYAEYCQEPITNETALMINKLCMSDPFFISCVIQNDSPNKDLTTPDGVVEAVNYEISDRHSEMSETWNEYLQLTLPRINDKYAKTLLLHLSKHADCYWTPKSLKEKLQIDLDFYQIQDKLIKMSEADVIERGVSDIQFRGLQDGTLNLILRNRFEEEIRLFNPSFLDSEEPKLNLISEFQAQIESLKAENRKLRGLLNNVSGKFAEHQLATTFRSKKHFALSVFFDNVNDNKPLNIINVKERVIFQRDDGKGMEIDVVAESKCGRLVLVEIRKTQNKMGIKAVTDFQEKVEVYAKNLATCLILPAFLSLGGFTVEALEFCQTHGIGTANQIKQY